MAENVKAHGAVGDGVTDDGVAWNNARASLPAGGGMVFVPPGSYALTTAFTFGGQSNVLVWISAGVTLSGQALPVATGTNMLIDLRSGILHAPRVTTDPTSSLTGGAQYRTLSPTDTKWGIAQTSAAGAGSDEFHVRVLGAGAATGVKRQFQVVDTEVANTIRFGVNFDDGKAHIVGEVEIDGALNHDGTTVGFFGTAPATQRPANPDTSGATLAALETEVNELKQLLRDYGLLAT